MRMRSFWSGMVAAAVLASAVGAWRAGAERLAPASPPVIAMVNLENVLNNLDEVATRERDLQQFIQNEREKINKLMQDRDDLRAQAEVLAEGQAKQQVLEDALRSQFNAEFQQKLSSELISRKSGEVSADLFEKVLAAVEDISQQMGYDIVFSSDSGIQLQRGTDVQILRQIASRRVLYSNNAINISDDVLLLLNNQWAAGQNP